MTVGLSIWPGNGSWELLLGSLQTSESMSVSSVSSTEFIPEKLQWTSIKNYVDILNKITMNFNKMKNWKLTMNYYELVFELLNSSFWIKWDNLYMWITCAQSIPFALQQILSSGHARWAFKIPIHGGFHSHWGYKMVKLLQITPITMIYGRYVELLTMVYKPTYSWWAPPCTPKWMVYFMENPTKMDDEQGYPHFWKPPNVHWILAG